MGHFNRALVLSFLVCIGVIPLGCGRSRPSVNVPPGDAAVLSSASAGINDPDGPRLYVDIGWPSTGAGKECLILVAVGDVDPDGLDEFAEKYVADIDLAHIDPSSYLGLNGQLTRVWTGEGKMVTYTAFDPNPGVLDPAGSPKPEPPELMIIGLPLVAEGQNTEFVRPDGAIERSVTKGGGRLPTWVKARLYVKRDKKMVPVSNAVTLDM